MDRRTFLKATAFSSVAIVAGCNTGQQGDQTVNANVRSSNPAKLPRRAFGSARVPLSAIGFGGILVTDAPQEQANRLVAEAVERGVNYFDVAPTYGDAELKLGPALRPYRKDVFLACKTTERTREAAEKEFKRSLERLHTDHFDLYQLHGIKDVEKDVDAAFAKGGAMEVLLEAKQAGQVRHIGFSAHSTEAAFAAMDRYDFDSVLFPINFAMFYKGNFGPAVIERAKAKGVTILALKMLARQSWPKNDPDRRKYQKCWYQPVTDSREAELAVRFTLSQPVAASLPPGEETLFRLAVDLAMNFRPITESELSELKSLAAGLDPIFKHA
jgi:aryl-alcohol dehydrogenase-like predicted oxidoreductase